MRPDIARWKAVAFCSAAAAAFAVTGLPSPFEWVMVASMTILFLLAVTVIRKHDQQKSI